MLELKLWYNLSLAVKKNELKKRELPSRVEYLQEVLLTKAHIEIMLQEVPRVEQQ
ncbi:hypothetical protein Elgi_61590 [Paenibacillus elgii]|nr:hypothetical protein Elgi_61590 [Paenibacillus elgii]